MKEVKVALFELLDFLYGALDLQQQLASSLRLHAIGIFAVTMPTKGECETLHLFSACWCLCFSFRDQQFGDAVSHAGQRLRPSVSRFRAVSLETDSCELGLRRFAGISFASAKRMAATTPHAATAIRASKTRASKMRP